MIVHVPVCRSLNVIPSTLTRPLQAATHPRLALSRLEMVEQLILNHGITQPGAAKGAKGSTAGRGQDKSHSGMTCRTLSELGAQGLQHPAEAVRKVAERILVLVYRVNPRLVRKQLPPDDDITRRNLLYRQLYTDFDAIDVQRKREMQERQRGESSGSGSPAPSMAPSGKHPGTWRSASVASMSASWHLGQVSSLSPAPSPRPTLRRAMVGHAMGQNSLMSSSMSASMCASWANGANKSGSSSSSGSIASPEDPEPAVRHLPREHSDQEVDVKTCDFCGAVSESFSSDEGLNSHYWRACPLLTRCNECQQVVEIACLAVHLTGQSPRVDFVLLISRIPVLTTRVEARVERVLLRCVAEECELRALYRRCGGCTEAVPLQRMQLHVSSCVRKYTVSEVKPARG